MAFAQSWACRVAFNIEYCKYLDDILNYDKPRFYSLAFSEMNGIKVPVLIS